MRTLFAAAVAAVAALSAVGAAPPADHIPVDHCVRMKSTVPSLRGQVANAYARERVDPGLLLRSASLADRVVLFVHGAGTPAEVAFDVPHPGCRWMAYLAADGFDVFSMDQAGYGRSTRPVVRPRAGGYAARHPSAVSRLVLVPPRQDGLPPSLGNQRAS